MPWSTMRGQRVLAPLAVLLLFTVAAAAATASGGPRQEDPAQRTAHSSTYVDTAGRHSVRVYAGPVHYRDASGAWQAIDNTLVPDGSGGVTNAANSFHASLPSDLSAPVRYDTPQGWVSFQLAGARGHGAANGAHDTYAAALPGVDVAYAVGNAGVKETLTLADGSAPSTYSYALSTSPGLSPRLNRSGGVDFLDPTGAVAFTFAPPSMVDAAGAWSNNVRFKLSHGGTELTLAADKQWLASSSRAWPVVIDPSFVANGADRECSIRDGADAGTSFCGGASIDVGSDGTQTSRGLLVWDLSWLPANTIVQSATLGLYVQDEANGTPVAVDVHHVTAPWTVSTTWNEADTGVAWATPGGDFGATDASATIGGVTGVTATWDVTALAQHWVDGSLANDGVILTAPSGGNLLHFATSSAAQTSQMPYLDVTYDSAPETTITGGPSGSSSSTSASFTFNSDTYGATFQCSLDGAAYAACTSPAAYGSLPVGSHSFAVRAVSPGGTVDPTPASRSWTVTAPAANLLANGSFEGSVAGWTGSTATLSLAADGVVGTGAARVARTSGSSFSIVTSSKPVGSTTAGAAYTAGGWLRSATPGRKVCLVLREWTPAGAIYASRSVCLTSSRTWTQFASNRYVAARSGDSLDVAATESGAVSGDSFEVDGLTLTQG